MKKLTKREKEVVGLVALGLTNIEIAKYLNVSYSTVKNHVGHILAKCNVRNRTELATMQLREEIES